VVQCFLFVVCNFVQGTAVDFACYAHGYGYCIASVKACFLTVAFCIRLVCEEQRIDLLLFFCVFLHTSD